MSSWNNVSVIGNLGQNPEIRYFESGTCVAEVTIAIYQGKDKQRGEDYPPTWIAIKAWKKSAESLANLVKGQRVQVTGSLKHDEWNDRNTGDKRTKLYINADVIAVLPRAETTESQPVASQPARQPQPAYSGAANGSPNLDDIPY